MARDLLADLRRLDRQVKDNEAEIREAVAATHTTSTTPPGLGIVLAAEVIGHVGDATRFPTEHHFASYTGSAPLDASSGNNIRHRLNTGGNRALNSVLHTISICQIRDGERGQTTTCAKLRKERRPQRPAEPSDDACPTWSTRIMKSDQRNHLAQPPDTQRRYQVVIHPAGASGKGPRQPDRPKQRQPSRASVSD
ncbi:transposase [Streptomyces sp. 061-3]|uniref:transposase n=1 Tax=Streptomyces sp. 061-3 TaxID=2789268 RepID=UPI00397FEC8E